MAELYNMTPVKEATTIADVVVAANRATAGSNALIHEGLLVGGFLFAVYIIMLMVLRQEFKDKFMVASFVCFILSIFLRAAEMVSFTIVLVFLVLTAVSVLISFLIK